MAFGLDKKPEQCSPGLAVQRLRRVTEKLGRKCKDEVDWTASSRGPGVSYYYSMCRPRHFS